VTGCVVLLWDHLLTLGNEIKYVWGLSMGVSKGIFLFNRYFVEGALLYNVYGKFWGSSKRTSDLIPGITVLLDLHGELSQEVTRRPLPLSKSSTP